MLDIFLQALLQLCFVLFRGHISTLVPSDHRLAPTHDRLGVGRVGSAHMNHFLRLVRRASATLL